MPLNCVENAILCSMNCRFCPLTCITVTKENFVHAFYASTAAAENAHVSGVDDSGNDGSGGGVGGDCSYSG